MALNFGKLSLWVALWFCVPISLFGMCSTGMTASPTEGPKLVWKKTFSGEQGRVFLDLALLPDDSIIVTGFLESTDSGADKALVMHVNPGGELIWEKTFGGKGWSRANAVTALTHGEFAVAVSEQTEDPEVNTIRMLRLDEMGNVIWDRTYEGRASTGAYGIAALPQQRIVVAGYIKAEGREDFDVLVMGLDKGGEFLWAWSFGDENTEAARGITAFPDGSLAVVGFARILNSEGLFDLSYFWVNRLGPKGTELWHKNFTGFGRDTGNAIALLSDGSVAVAGVKDNRKQPSNADIGVQRLADDGTILWNRGFGGSGFDAAYAITPRSNGGIAVAGTTKSVTGDDLDALVLALDNDGFELGRMSIVGNGNDRAFGIAEASDRSVIAVGVTEPENGKPSQGWIAKLSLE